MFLIRWCAGFTGIGCAIALGFGGDWPWAVVILASILLPTAWRVRCALLGTRDAMYGEPVPGKHRRQGRPAELRQAPAREFSDIAY